MKIYSAFVKYLRNLRKQRSCVSVVFRLPVTYDSVRWEFLYNTVAEFIIFIKIGIKMKYPNETHSSVLLGMHLCVLFPITNSL